jgi:glycosyltransferase involved in cell wall biosynthesis
VEDGKDGLVFDPTNTAALGALMVQMSSGKVDLIAMGQAARQKIQAWGVERFAKNLLKALKIGLG